MRALAPLTLFLLYLNAPVVVTRAAGVSGELAAIVPLLLLVPIFLSVVGRGEPIIMPKVLGVAFGLLLVHVISSLVSQRPHESLPHTLTLALEGVFLALLVVNAVRTRAQLLACVAAVLAAGALMGLIVTLQQFLGAQEHTFFGFAQLDSAISDDAGRVRYRLAGPIGETNRFAQVLAVLLPVAAVTMLHTRGWARIASAAATVLLICGIALTFSRGALVALAVAAPFALVLRLVAVRHLVIVVLLGGFALATSPHYAERAASIVTVAAQGLGITAQGVRNADGAARGRITEMAAAGMMFLEAPLVGVGPGLAPSYYREYAGAVGGKVRPGRRRSHNLYLQLAAETGLAGLLAFGTLLYMLFRGLHQARRRVAGNDPTLWALAGALQLSLLVFVLSSLFLHAAFIRYFWLMVGLTLSAVIIIMPRPVLPGRLLSLPWAPSVRLRHL